MNILNLYTCRHYTLVVLSINGKGKGREERGNLLALLIICKIMRQRMKVALADIRYVQTEIEKILNRTSRGTKPDSPDGKRSNDNSLRNSQYKVSNFSTTPIKKQEKTYRNTSPKTKRADVVKVETFNAAPIPSKGIFTIKQEKQQHKALIQPVRTTAGFVVPSEENSQKNVMAMWKEKEKLNNIQTANSFSKIPEDHPHRNVMDLWKERQKMNGGGGVVSKQKQKGDKTAVKGKKSKKKKSQKSLSPTNIPKQAQMKTPKMKKAPVEQVIVSGTITVPVKVDLPYYLQQKNQIRLRTDEDFLIKRYAYSDKQQQNLKQKYKVLDERLQKLRSQFVPKKGGPLQDQEQWQFKNKKKFALQSYVRYSPLGKLLKINQKLRRDQQRSLSQQVRKRKEVVQEDSDKPKWV